MIEDTSEVVTRWQFRCRVDALEAVWRRWAAIGEELSERQWSAVTRCPGWDVAALYAHVGMFPPAITDPPSMPSGASGDPVTAVDILRGFNAAGGVAHQMAEHVAQAALRTAADLERSALVVRYTDAGPRAIAALRRRERPP